jgi:hypothetical protein
MWMKRFFAQNWFNLGTLLISVIALVVAVQSNLFAKEANDIARSSTNPLLNVVGDNETGNITVTGCNYDSQEPYRLKREMLDIFTFLNKGGLSASLLKVRFFEGEIEYPHVNIRALDRERYLAEGELLDLPLDIEAGKARTWVVQASDLSSWRTIEDALRNINYPDPSSQILPRTKTPGKWVFEFSDGTIIDSMYKDGWYDIHPHLLQQLQETKCD